METIVSTYSVGQAVIFRRSNGAEWSGEIVEVFDGFYHVEFEDEDKKEKGIFINFNLKLIKLRSRSVFYYRYPYENRT